MSAGNRVLWLAVVQCRAKSPSMTGEVLRRRGTLLLIRPATRKGGSVGVSGGGVILVLTEG